MNEKANYEVEWTYECGCSEREYFESLSDAETQYNHMLTIETMCSKCCKEEEIPCVTLSKINIQYIEMHNRYELLAKKILELFKEKETETKITSLCNLFAEFDIHNSI